MDAQQEITGLSRDELSELLSDKFGLPAFRARQLIQWVHKRRVKDFELMSDISKPLREQLSSYFSISRPSIVTKQVSRDGTRKYLFELSDGSKVESVLIRQPTRFTLCVSSQVGCAIGCSFCRTALMGLKRNLQTHEILGQVLAVQDDLEVDPAVGGVNHFSNIVFMGMGEPLHNYTNVSAALWLLNDELGHDFSNRKITVSTSGLVPAIKKFFEDEVPANLAVSLNATTDEQRDVLIPINKKWPLADLLKTLREVDLKRRRRITIEYVMLGEVNDTKADLERLPGLVEGIPSKINLIPYNENAGLGYKAPLSDNVHKWQDALLSKGLNTTIRWSKGVDISAACGQLATESKKKKKE